jgi:hypothetical protein
MKKALLAFVIFSALYLIGCNENSITDPVSSQSVNKLVNQDARVIRGTIPLDRILVLPGLGTNYYHLFGSINYKEELFNSKPNLAELDYNVDLGILVDATLTNTTSSGNDSNSWIIYSESENKFYVSPEGIYIFEKSYPVRGSTESLRLICKFSATTDGIELNSIKLATKNSR